MRPSLSMILACALTAATALAADPVKPDAVVAPVAEETDREEGVYFGPQKEHFKPLDKPGKTDPSIVPERPLSDTSRAAEEKARLVADSDEALDRELGLDSRTDPNAAPEGMGFQLVKTLFTLALVVGLIYLVLNFGLRKLMGIRSGPTGGKKSVVDVVERIPLEQRRTLFVLKAAGEYLLIGTSEGGMTLISKLDTAEVERIQRERTAAQVQLSPFFQKLLSGRKSGPPPSA